ncbi:MAG: hypothetical protein JNM93_03055 [Bacteriovoracaceae bacterium]|nr:hypothetical protein [Bacteriovoracaceae bacterium]
MNKIFLFFIFFVACSSGPIFFQDTLIDVIKQPLSTFSDIEKKVDDGADINEVKNDESALMVAIDYRRTDLEDVVSYLLFEGAKINFQNNEGETLLTKTIKKESLLGDKLTARLLRIYFKYGAEKNLRNEVTGDTPLHVALSESIALNRMTTSAHFLLKYGGKRDVMNHKTYTPSEMMKTLASPELYQSYQKILKEIEADTYLDFIQ